mmetsp:Transcript_56599/g.132804  ORF Transcript_56599/g.132804 Transcript_56599/m.132804 type:complete len:265 (+) Transcript_56599:93-887(+)
MLHDQPQGAQTLLSTTVGPLSETIRRAGLPHEHEQAQRTDESASRIASAARQEPRAKAAALVDLVEMEVAWEIQMKLAAMRAAQDLRTDRLNPTTSGETSLPDSSLEQSDQPINGDAWQSSSTHARSGQEAIEQRQVSSSASASADDAAQDKMFRTRRQQFLRTQLCTFYQQGRCLRAEKCTFAHSTEQVRNMPDLRKTTLCQAWMWRSCPLPKEQCTFAHGRADLRTTEAFWRTSLCKMHMRGRCQQGDACRYAHGPEELRRD